MKIDSRRALMAFVRGESSWRDLQELGLQVQLGDDVRVTVPSDFPLISPNLVDVASGLISHQDDAARREWASLFLAIGTIDLARLEQEKDWPELLEAVWDASEGDASEASLAFARSLLAGTQRRH